MWERVLNWKGWEVVDIIIHVAMFSGLAISIIGGTLAVMMHG